MYYFVSIEMHLSLKSLVFFVFLGIPTISTDNIHQENDDCPEHCYCDVNKVNCTDFIPFSVPGSVEDVVIYNPTEKTLIPRAFCKVSWPKVSKLTLHSNEDQQPDLRLVDNLFNCLNQLKVLKIQSEDKPVDLYRNSFVGLDNVVVLDLTGCSRILSEMIYIALSERTILPKLSRLILANVANAWGSFKVTQNFTNVLGYRNITELNLSSTTVSFHVDDFSPLCDSLTTVNISRDFILDSDLNDNVPCNSLRTIDLSSVHFPKSRQLPTHMKIENIDIDISRQTQRRMYDTVSTIFANNLISREHVISIINCSVTLPDNSLTEAHVTEYNVPHFDLKLKTNSSNLAYLDLSANSIETIGRDVFSNLKRITKLDLSNNSLSKCNSFDETFNVLFQNNQELETVNLANNGLTYLPKESFTRNLNLKSIYLSNNAFERITFEIAHMRHLTLLDLMNNKIVYLDNKTTRTLDRLFKMHLNGTQNENKTLVVNLLGNPFKCHCAALGFVEWFVHTPVFDSTRSLYDCEAGGRRVAMSEAAVDEAREDCERPVRRRRIIILCSTIPTISITTAIIVTYILVTRRRKRLASQQFEDTVRLIRDGDTRFQFPVFLSFSSENQAFVLKHVLEPLQVR